MKKSNGKLYWYGVGSDPLLETDSGGALQNEYIFFRGNRLARRDVSDHVFYYIADHLGTSRVITDSAGTVCYEADYYPYGGERVITNTCPQNYKFTGKERDSETQNDYFGARFYESNLGRFMSGDQVQIRANRLLDPQRLNLYGYVRNNPLKYFDPDGEELILSSGMSKTDADRILRDLATAYRKETGRAAIQGLAKSAMKHIWTSGTLSGHAPENPNVAKKYGETKPFFVGTTDAKTGEVKTVDRPSSAVLVTVDLSKIDRDQRDEKRIAWHELAHDQSYDKDPVAEGNRTDTESHQVVDDFLEEMDEQKNSMDQRTAEEEVKKLILPRQSQAK